jgi:hypothetical protein
MGQEIDEILADIQKALDLVNASGPVLVTIEEDDLATVENETETILVDPTKFFGDPTKSIGGVVDFGDNLPFNFATGEPSLFPDGTMYGLFPNGELNADEDGDQIPDLLQDGSFERFTDARLAGNTFSFNNYDQEYGRETVRISLSFNEDYTFTGQRIDFSEISRSTTPLSGTWAAGEGNGWNLVLMDDSPTPAEIATIALESGDEDDDGSIWLEVEWTDATETFSLEGVSLKEVFSIEEALTAESTNLSTDLDNGDVYGLDLSSSGFQLIKPDGPFYPTNWYLENGNLVLVFDEASCQADLPCLTNVSASLVKGYRSEHGGLWLTLDWTETYSADPAYTFKATWDGWNFTPMPENNLE